MDRGEMQKNDPLKKQGTMSVEDQGLSPMDPPDAYAIPSSVEKIPYEDMHVFLRTLLDEHKAFQEVIANFEESLNDIRKNGFSRENDKKVRNFFKYFDQEFGVHNRKEEKNLFPLLHRRFLEKGEHSQGTDNLQTPVTMLEEDHLTATQQAAVVFNFLSLSHRLPDHNSRLIVLDLALEQGKSLVELLALHIFREENIVFPLAQKLLSKSELDHIGNESLI